MAEVVVKVQKPLFPPDGEILIYNENRSIFMVLRPDAPALAGFNLSAKGFYDAELLPGGGIRLIRAAAYHEW